MTPARDDINGLIANHLIVDLATLRITLKVSNGHVGLACNQAINDPVTCVAEHANGQRRSTLF